MLGAVWAVTAGSASVVCLLAISNFPGTPLWALVGLIAAQLLAIVGAPIFLDFPVLVPFHHDRTRADEAAWKRPYPRKPVPGGRLPAERHRANPPSV